MNSHPQPLNFDPPRFLCFPVRPLLIFTSGFGILSGLIAILKALHHGALAVSPGILIFLDVLIFIGAYYNDERALKWSRRVVIFSLWLVIINAFIWPVLVSSMCSLGMPHFNGTETLESELSNFEGAAPANLFFMALALGYLVELVFAIWIGKIYIQYTLINRLWVHVKLTTVGSEGISNPNYVQTNYANQYIVH